MTSTALTVRANSPHNVIGPRQNAIAHYKQHGVALWLRASGRVTLFYTDSGQMRQKTWGKFSYVIA